MADRLIRASEVGEYAYCARAWWLARVLGRERENVRELAAGRVRHVRHGQGIALAALLQQLGLILLLTALVVAVLWGLLGGGR
jgi:hypothetical protein